MLTKTVAALLVSNILYVQCLPKPGLLSEVVNEHGEIIETGQLFLKKTPVAPVQVAPSVNFGKGTQIGNIIQKRMTEADESSQMHQDGLAAVAVYNQQETASTEQKQTILADQQNEARILRQAPAAPVQVSPSVSFGTGTQIGNVVQKRMT